MEIINAIMLFFASFVIIFLVFFINFLQKMLGKEQEQKLEILLYFSKNYENLFERCLKAEREIVILRKDIFFLRDNYIPKCPECAKEGMFMEIMQNWKCERCGYESKK